LTGADSGLAPSPFLTEEEVQKPSARLFSILLLSLVTVSFASAQNFTNLLSFQGINGANPYSAMVQGYDGNFYGTTLKGGTFDSGTVFRVTPQGALTTLYSFCTNPSCFDGAYPFASLFQASDGNLYGTTQEGGFQNAGTIFRIAENGKPASVYSFCAQANCNDGISPSGVVEGTDGNFYGTTSLGGTTDMGTVFRITPSGKLTTIYTFCSQGGACPDGSSPGGGLVQASDGNFYGITEQGGANAVGTIFRMTPEGAITTLHSFDLTDGSSGIASLIQAADGNFYGTSEVGGPHAGGTVYKMTPSGAYSVIYYFCSQGSPCTDGASPLGGVTQGSDGNFYGTTVSGGAFNFGTAFKLTPAGELSIYSFTTFGGNYPYAGLLLATNGILYGTTYAGGANLDGTLFSIAVGLRPDVETTPAAQKEGTVIGILGQGFTTASTVTFGGVPSSQVTLHGASALTAVVPAGAPTGPVTVTTGDATLTSVQPFRVIPEILSFNPASGPVGQTVTITGSGLAQTIKINFGNVPATNVNVTSDTEVTAEVPTGAKTGHIVVETKGGIAVSASTFTVTQ
jgi:uncharacterized repeat protein (TIGR03803 family)